MNVTEGAPIVLVLDACLSMADARKVSVVAAELEEPAPLAPSGPETEIASDDLVPVASSGRAPPAAKHFDSTSEISLGEMGFVWSARREETRREGIGDERGEEGVSGI